MLLTKEELETACNNLSKKSGYQWQIYNDKLMFESTETLSKEICVQEFKDKGMDIDVLNMPHAPDQFTCWVSDPRLIKEMANNRFMIPAIPNPSTMKKIAEMLSDKTGLEWIVEDESIVFQSSWDNNFTNSYELKDGFNRFLKNNGINVDVDTVISSHGEPIVFAAFFDHFKIQELHQLQRSKTTDIKSLVTKYRQHLVKMIKEDHPEIAMQDNIPNSSNYDEELNNLLKRYNAINNAYKSIYSVKYDELTQNHISEIQQACELCLENKPSESEKPYLTQLLNYFNAGFRSLYRFFLTPEKKIENIVNELIPKSPGKSE